MQLQHLCAYDIGWYSVLYSNTRLSIEQLLLMMLMMMMMVVCAGWCLFFKLDFRSAQPHFQRSVSVLLLLNVVRCCGVVVDVVVVCFPLFSLELENSWSKGFYCYMSAVCSLETGDYQQALTACASINALCNRKYGGQSIPSIRCSSLSML